MRKIEHSVLNAKLHQKEADNCGYCRFEMCCNHCYQYGRSWYRHQAESGSEAAGGLAIIGTERHESRRVDRQLRGRAGRQGDPGSLYSSYLWKMT